MDVELDDLETLLQIDENDYVILKRSMVDGSENLRKLNLNFKFIVGIERDALQELKRLESIDLSNNLISDLDSDLFVNNKYLKEVVLANNCLISIDKYLFLLVNNLTHLNLSFNFIEKVDEFCLFSFCLSHLDLSNNKIRIVNSDAFFFTSKLVFLNLSNNRIQNLEITAPQLKYLDVSNNALNFVQVDSVSLKTMLLKGHKIAILEHCFHPKHQFLTELDLQTDVVNGIQNVNENSFKNVSLLRVLCLTVNDNFDFSSLNDLLLLSSFHLHYNGERNLTPTMRSIGDFLSGKNYLESLKLVFRKFYTCYLNRIGKLYALQKIHLECLNATSITTNLNVGLLFKHSVRLTNISLVNLNYFAIPENCNAGVLEREDFLKTTSLVLIGLKNLTITNYFRIFTRLEYLNLSNGELKFFGKNVFKDLISLKKLYIENSKLSSIPATLFMHNINLEMLSVANNHISTIEDYSFFQLKKLQLLDLRGNPLEKLNRNTFYDLGSIGAAVKLDEKTIQAVLNFIY